YILRLVGFLRNSYQRLNSYLGSEEFSKIAESYIRSIPSREVSSLRYVKGFVDFLSEDEYYCKAVDVIEVAAIEEALLQAKFSADERQVSVSVIEEFLENGAEFPSLGISVSASI